MLTGIHPTPPRSVRYVNLNLDTCNRKLLNAFSSLSLEDRLLNSYVGCCPQTNSNLHLMLPKYYIRLINLFPMVSNVR